jgi:hypothetical protein
LEVLMLPADEDAMSTKVTLSVSGRGTETDAPTVEDLLGQVRDYFDVLAQVEAALAEDGESAIEWRITNAHKNSPLSIEAEAFPRQFGVNVDRRTELVIESVASGLRQLQQAAQRPAYFNDKALTATQRIFDRVTNGLDMTRFEHNGGRPTIELTTSSARVSASNVREVLAPKGRPYKEFGSVEGHFLGISRDRGRPVFRIKHRLSGDEVKCFVSGEAEREISIREIGEVWSNRRLQVHGTIHFKAAGRISHIDATQVRFMRERNELPDLNEIVDPDFTGGLASEDYVARLRDGE